MLFGCCVRTLIYLQQSSVKNLRFAFQERLCILCVNGEDFAFLTTEPGDVLRTCSHRKQNNWLELHAGYSSADYSGMRTASFPQRAGERRRRGLAEHHREGQRRRVTRCAASRHRPRRHDGNHLRQGKTSTDKAADF